MTYINCQLNGEIFEIAFNRPEAYNAFHADMFIELKEACDQAAESSARIVVIKGMGKGFSAGGDIGMMMNQDREEDFHHVMNLIEDITLSLARMKKVTIALVHGAAAGLAFSFALSCDYLFMHQDAKLAMNFNGIGLIPDGGGHFLLAKRVSEQTAKHLIWSGKKLSAEEALELRLADGVFHEDIDTYQTTCVKPFLNMPLQAFVETKMIYFQQSESQLLSFLQKERAAQARLRKSHDHKEGIQAFLEKRRPVFEQV
ncbi:enoyl-CoA hydratase [Bacillus sp. 179-C3.3 HS]|uniref:enoyl-CoA hydratase n=1 Tax=Bacillus sp. 179-C3.3 HS TaxID=3232162 RepID=UPI00399EF741